MEQDESVNHKSLTAVYSYRWMILVLFCVFAATNFIQFMQYSIVANIITKYYSVDNFLVDVTSIIYLIVFIPFCIPVNYLIEKYNLKTTAIISSGLTVCGNLLKLLSIPRDRFYVAILGQTLCGIGQVFILSIPSKLASVWFGPKEVSTACAIAIMGVQGGIALGCLLPSFLVKNSDKMEDVGHDLFQMLLYNAVLSCVVFCLVLIFFRSRPMLPPSQSQINILESEEVSTKAAIKSLIENRTYWLLLVIFGIGTGIWTAAGILINSIYLNYFPGSESDLGIITLISVISGGCIGSVIFGYILDKTDHFKRTTFLVLLLAAIAFIFVICTLELRIKAATYFSLPLYVFFLGSTLLISYEFITEVTYPLPESLACGVLNATVNVFGIAFTFIFEACFGLIGFFWTEILIFGIILMGASLVYFVTPTLHRRNANSGS